MLSFLIFASLHSISKLPSVKKKKKKAQISDCFRRLEVMVSTAEINKPHLVFSGLFPHSNFETLLPFLLIVQNFGSQVLLLQLWRIKGWKRTEGSMDLALGGFSSTERGA